MANEAPSEAVVAIISDLHQHRNKLKQSPNYERLVEPYRIQIRELARESAIDFISALSRMLQTRQCDDTEKAVWSAACLDCIEGGEVPEAAGKEPKQEKIAKKVPSWAKTLCKGGTRLAVPVRPVHFGNLREIFLLGAYKEPVIHQERAEGFCDIDYAHDLTFSDSERCLFGDVAVVGWRVDERKVNSGLLKSEVEKACRKWMQDNGKNWCPKPVRQEMRETVKADLLKKALPTRRIFPVIWALAEGWILVQGPKKVVKSFRAWCKREKFQAETWDPTSCINPDHRIWLELLGSQCTDLRLPNAVVVSQSGSADGDELGAGALNDFFLWIAILGCDTGKLREEGRNLEWSLDGKTILYVPKPEKGIIRVELSGTEHVFHAALAEGGHVAEVRIQMTELFLPESEGEAIRETFHLTLSREEGGLEISALGFPKLPESASGDDAILAEVYARVETYKRLVELLQLLLRAYASARITAWQPVVDAGRLWVGAELKRRYAFDAETGQGWLFAPKEARWGTGVGEA